MKEEVDNGQLEVLLCSVNSFIDVGDCEFVVVLSYVVKVFIFIGVWQLEREGFVDLGLDVGFYEGQKRIIYSFKKNFKSSKL